MHVVDTVIHDGRGDVLAGDPLGPGRGHVQVQLGLAPILARVLQVPLVLEQGVRRVCGLLQQYRKKGVQELESFEFEPKELPISSQVGYKIEAICLIQEESAKSCVCPLESKNAHFTFKTRSGSPTKFSTLRGLYPRLLF